MATKRKKRNDGNYAIRRKVAPYKDKNGKIQEYRTFYGKTVKEATDKFKAYQAGAENTPVFFDDMIEAYIADTFLPDPSLKPRSKQRYLDAYRKNLEPQKDFIYKPLKDVTYQDIQKAYNKMTCKPSGVEACHKLLVHFFQLMLATGTIEKNPLVGVIVPKPEKKTEHGEIITFADKEIEAIKAYIMREDLPAYEQKRVDRLRFLTLLLIHTGVRIGEALALSYDDISPEGISINKQVISKPVFKEGKTSGYELVIDDTKTDYSVRFIPITESLYNAFMQHKSWHKKEQLRKKYRTEYVFTTGTGKLYDRRSLRHSFDRIHSAAGVPCHGVHAYRRTFGTKLAREGTPIQVLRDLMGHADISITAKYYIGISDDEKKTAVALLG